LIRVLREDALCAVNDCGQAITPSDVLPNAGRYRNSIKPLYAAWLICYIEELRLQGWPDLPVDNNYTDSSGVGLSLQETALLYATEMALRLESCGDYGRLLLAYYRDGLPVARRRGEGGPDLIGAFALPASNQRERAESERRAEKDINAALSYVSGKRKKLPFAVWRNHSHRRRMAGNHSCTDAKTEGG
jgi:hypothetical protein